MARNRKRAKERRARRPEPVISAHPEREDALARAREDREAGAPDPIGHATPDVELAEAQLALGRPELAGAEQPEPADEDEGFEFDESDQERELADADGGGRGGGWRRTRRGFGGEGDGEGELGERGELVTRPRRPGSRLVGFLQGSWRELQRVQWPDRRQVIQATGVVIGFVIIAGVFLGASDWVAGKLVTFILK